MIPKIIHYCWFGGNPLPDLAIKCIESWKKYCPDFEIKEWNESNYDLNSCDYVKEAAMHNKWAFVSDYARYDILYRYGGVYLDTDVELIKPIDDILNKGAFFGIEDSFNTKDKEKYMIAPGLGMGVPQQFLIIKELLQIYKNEHFILEDGSYNKKTVVDYMTDIMKKYGFDEKNREQVCGGVTIYPAEFFCPMNYSTGIITLTQNTRSIHHYNMSWKSEYEKKLKSLERCFKAKFGDQIGWYIYRLVSLPVRACHKLIIKFRRKG